MNQYNIRVVVVDDCPMDLEIVSAFLKNLGVEFTSFLDPQDALVAVLRETSPCLVLCDISMPQFDGFAVLKRITSEGGKNHLIFISGQADLEISIKAMRMGTLDFILKPLQLDLIEARLKKAFDFIQAKYELQQTRSLIFSGQATEPFVGKSAAMERIFTLIQKVADFDSTIMITGESGVGKEKVARAIHQRSQRRKGEFVAINCASMPEQLIESELFGYVKGAFTGAQKDTPGLFLVASGGTLFLDEIGEMPAMTQSKLLRVLQEKEIRPVGGKKTSPIDVRIICATHLDLEKMVKEKRFREDLFFRLNVVPIHIPPLRERREDLQVLIPFVMQKLNDRMGMDKRLSAQALAFIDKLSFRGNVRELENLLERSYIYSTHSEIGVADFQTPENTGAIKSLFNMQALERLPSLKEVELAYIQEVLSRTVSKEEAAAILGIGRKTLYRKGLPEPTDA